MKIMNAWKAMDGVASNPWIWCYEIRLDGKKELSNTENVPAAHLKQIKDKLPVVLLLDRGQYCDYGYATLWCFVIFVED